MQESQESNDGCLIVLSLIVRAVFLCFLVGAGGFGALMVGFSGDSGTNPVFVYLSLSLLLFLGSGFFILISPARVLFSGRLLFNILWLIFFISMIQPFIVSAFVGKH